MRPEDEKRDVAGQESEAQAAENAAESTAAETSAEESADERAFEEGMAEADDAPAAPESEEEYFSEKKPEKRRKRVRLKDMTPEQRRRYNIRAIVITSVVCGLVLVFFGICALCSWVGYTGNFDYIATIEAIDYDSPFTLIEPEDSDTGYYEFVADSAEDSFRVLHLTDVHIGAGAFSAEKDRWAIEAVSETVRRVKPDLVIVTGDMAYPVPFQAGTFNNKREAEMFASMMERLGVYWTIGFGNHDTEIYSLYDRDEIAAQVYMDKESYPHCLFREGPTDIAGKGNDVIVVRHPTTDGVEIVDAASYEANVGSTKISQALVTIDSHSYTDGDYFGIAWKYDNIHQDQIDWYAAEMDRLTAVNEANGFEDATVKNLVFFHIPLTEYGRYYEEYKDNGHKNTDNVHLLYGKAGESGEKSFPGVKDCQMFETMILHGGQGTFCGHDHYNTYALDVKATVTAEDGSKVTGAIRLSYGMSIDYLAYAGIANHIEQRGGTEILTSADGSFATRQWPYQGNTKAPDPVEFTGLAAFADNN